MRNLWEIRAPHVLGLPPEDGPALETLPAAGAAEGRTGLRRRRGRRTVDGGISISGLTAAARVGSELVPAASDAALQLVRPPPLDTGIAAFGQPLQPALEQRQPRSAAREIPEGSS